jgi:hypothetical protein
MNDELPEHHGELRGVRRPAGAALRAYRDARAR